MELLGDLLLLCSWPKGVNTAVSFGGGSEGNWLPAGAAVPMSLLLPQTMGCFLEDPASGYIDGVSPLSSCLPWASLLHQRTPRKRGKHACLSQREKPMQSMAYSCPPTAPSFPRTQFSAGWWE